MVKPQQWLKRRVTHVRARHQPNAAPVGQWNSPEQFEAVSGQLLSALPLSSLLLWRGLKSEVTKESADAWSAQEILDRNLLCLSSCKKENLSLSRAF